ncbi:hypothetical protein QR77_14790 [Streptomyces sp. 150FB]|uniref:damage-control phosphatase ARMT1 family protein n=1 Tax=Streptomyces sp. 150FB TaxID=1576605 RepID=UPI0005894E8A|nr:damage-control phosphatase ARMT1 family protein [Streptomyces sp. 150FB]KIF78840.1 hypothetical protein QR77_14790 [Streptomyces sp. 150FB]
MRDARDTRDAPVILGNPPGSFAWGVLVRRHPALIEQVRGAFPYAPTQHRRLDALLREITDGVIEPLAPGDDHDRAQWEEWGREYVGRSWFDAPFLWVESYFYRRLLSAVGYFGPGPWQGIDPFGPFKRAELHGDAVAEELAALDDLGRLTSEEQATALLRGSLWGNRADLGFRMDTDPGTGPGDAVSRLVSDDSALLWSLLPMGSDSVHLIADNAGRELIPDLVLIDHLLTTGRAARAVLYVKPHPYYVSDATTADLVDCVRRLGEASGSAGETGGRLREAMGSGQLAVRTHEFFCAPFPYSAMPDGLRGELACATLTLVKGDLNYRRLVGDRRWPGTTPFAELTSYFPGPVAALRTLKCDVVAGLDPDVLANLEGGGQEWRTSGTHALIQVKP